MDRHLCRSWAQNPRSEVSPQAPPPLNKKGLTFMSSPLFDIMFITGLASLPLHLRRDQHIQKQVLQGYLLSDPRGLIFG